VSIGGVFGLLHFLKEIKMEEQMTGNPDPSGNIDYYESIFEKEEKCKEMVGYNDSLVVGNYIEKTKKIGERK
jgi:hypothetical protein